MTIPAITPDPINPPTDTPQRNDTDFRTKADVFVDWQGNTFPTEIDAFITEMNATITQMNLVSAQVDEDSEITEQARLTTVGAVNFKGYWAGLTGELAMPASVAHGGHLWLLTENLADVTAVEPTTPNTEWFLVPEQLRIGDIAYLAAAKTNWLACDGATYLQSAYPDLYALIGQYVDLTTVVTGTPTITDATNYRAIFDDDYIYFFGMSSGDTVITRIAKSDFTKTELTIPGYPVSWLTQDDTYIYIQQSVSTSCLTVITKSTFTITAGTPTIFYGLATGVAVDSGVIYIGGGPTSGDKFCAITVATWTVIAASVSTDAVGGGGSRIYFTNAKVYSYDRVYTKSDWSSTTAGTLALPVQNDRNAITEDATYIYLGHTYINNYGCTRINKSTDVATQFRTAGSNQATFALDNDTTYIYAACEGPSPYLQVIKKADLSVLTGTPVLPDDCYAVAVDDDHVYCGHVASPILTIINKSDWSVVDGTPVIIGNVYAIDVDATMIYLAHFGGTLFTAIGSTHDPATEFAVYNIPDAVSNKAKAYIKAV